MAPQLQINQGPQDALLFDNSRSYFTNVGYVRTSNFQMELRDVDPQNAANLGATVQFVIPKAADLLGPVDLLVEMAEPTSVAGVGAHCTWGWVETLGYAMIDRITFSVGSHDVEVLTGEHLNIMNELMRDDKNRFGYSQIGKTGKPLMRYSVGGFCSQKFVHGDPNDPDRAITGAFVDGVPTVKSGRKMIIPLGLFFTHHPSKYFPLAAIAGCNDVRITIRFKTKEELLCADAPIPVRYSELDPNAAPVDAGLANLQFPNGNAFVSGSCQLRCHYIHVTGPEATQLMNREHVRLMKFWTGNHVSKVQRITCTPEGRAQSVDIDLSFLHPVTELVITIRKSSDMTGLLSTAAQLGDSNATQVTARPAMTKSYFSYHGGGYNPNLDEWPNRYDLETQTSRLVQVNASAINFPTWAGSFQNPVVQATTPGNTVALVGRWETGWRVQLVIESGHGLGTDTFLPSGEYELHGAVQYGEWFGSMLTHVQLRAVGTTTPLTWTYDGEHGVYGVIRLKNDTGSAQVPTHLLTTSFNLRLNGQSRHLDGDGIDRDYLMNRLMPMLHSNATEEYRLAHGQRNANKQERLATAQGLFAGNSAQQLGLSSAVTHDASAHELQTLSEIFDRKEIYVFPFALNPEGANPSGSVNFSKVSHAKLSINLNGIAPGLTGAALEDDYQFDVYGVHYNWLAIKEGRALTSFA